RAAATSWRIRVSGGGGSPVRSLTSATPASSQAREARDPRPVEVVADRVARGCRCLPQGRQVERREAAARELRRAFAQQRPRALEVAVGEMLQANCELDQALERLALGPRRRPPVRLEQLVDLEVEARVEERGRVAERLVEPPVLAIARGGRAHARAPARARSSSA